MKYLLLLVLTTLTSCTAEPPLVQNIEPKTEYIVLNPNLIGKCFFNKNNQLGFQIKRIDSDSGYNVDFFYLVKEFRTNKKIIAINYTSISRISPLYTEINCKNVEAYLTGTK